MDELVWEAPGPGDWFLPREHVPYPVSRLFASILPAAALGRKVAGARYGLPTGSPQWATVNAWLYLGPEIPLGAGELAERDATAAEVLAGATPWRDEVARWHDVERPTVVAANRRLQEVDVGRLDDVALSAHLQRTIQNFCRWAPLHFEHAGFARAAGLLLEAGAGWGIDDHRLIALLAGGSPMSADLDRMASAVAAALDECGAPADVPDLAAVRRTDPAVAARLDRLVDDYALRPLAGRDVLEPTLGERPAILLAAIAARRGDGSDERGRRADPAEAELRRSLPRHEVPRFDELLADARATYALRDDDVGVCWNWPLGLIRTAGLVAGARLVEQGLLEEPSDLFEAAPDELSGVLAGRKPDGAELAARRELRVLAAAADPPRHLAGTEPAPTRPPHPPNVQALLESLPPVWSVSGPRVDAPLHGIGIGDREAVGRARLIRCTDDLVDVEPGEVLVAISTTTAFNAVFPVLGAVVTELGGLLSHAAVLARELDLPAVVGVADVFDHVRDGDLVRVDPTVGCVEVVDRAG